MEKYISGPLTWGWVWGFIQPCECWGVTLG
uniref:Uncharacterized protein n=1 Tax=Anguilla anguilla TaxID=7936 RepID=A0A0E9U7L6_ANGAN